MRFWKSYICSNKLEVQETNFSFSQFNRIRNHFLGNTHHNDQVRRDPCTNPVRARRHKLQTRKKIHGKVDDPNNVDFISSNVNSSRQEALLYVFEDNEAVIKMIIKGRSPTLRHVSRTHRVALDWLFDRINLDYKIQIK